MAPSTFFSSTSTWRGAWRVSATSSSGLSSKVSMSPRWQLAAQEGSNIWLCASEQRRICLRVSGSPKMIQILPSNRLSGSREDAGLAELARRRSERRRAPPRGAARARVRARERERAHHLASLQRRAHHLALLALPGRCHPPPHSQMALGTRACGDVGNRVAAAAAGASRAGWRRSGETHAAAWAGRAAAA